MGREMSIGMTGDDVKILQQLLNHHLCPPLDPIETDGIFGSGTKGRVIEFQKRNKNYPSTMPLPAGTTPEFKRPLVADGIVGRLTANVLFDIRTVQTKGPVLFTPYDLASRSSRSLSFGNSVGDPNPTPNPSPGPAPTPSPNNQLRSPTFSFIQLQIGQQGTVNPWSLSPFVFTGQYTLLAKNPGPDFKPDFLLTAGGQVALNDGGANGRWSAQGFLQMGLGGFPKLFGDKLDWFNPFVAVMLQENFKNKFGPDGPAGVGLGIGNQMTWTLLSKPLPGTTDSQDTLSLFINTQAVTVTDLSTGRSSAPSGQFLIGATKTFFLF